MTPTTVLASFCNRRSRFGDVLAGLDMESGELAWINLGSTAITSACGLAQTTDYVYCAFTDGAASYIAVLDRTLQLRDTVRLADVLDVHSICAAEGAIFAASTGTDEVVRLTLDDLSESETIWRAGPRRQDDNHVNCITTIHGRLVCSAFGPRTGPTWGDACDGYIYDISTDEYVLRGLYHPHSLVEHRGELYFCESAESSLRTISGPLRYVDGYSRGLAFDANGLCYVASSLGRRSNPLSRFMLNPSDPGTRAGTCTISMGMLASPASWKAVSLSGAAEEIYDLIIVTAALCDA